jgi:hypothetical protein
MKTPDFYFADHPLGNREWLVTSKELSRYFKVTMRTVHNWRVEGRIPFGRVTPRCVRYSLAAVEEALRKPDDLNEQN